MIGNPVVPGFGGAGAVLETLTVTTNGTFLPRQGTDGFSAVTVCVLHSPRSDYIMNFDWGAQQQNMRWPNTASVVEE